MDAVKHPCDGCRVMYKALNGRFCTRLKRYVEYMNTRMCEDT